MKHKQLTSHIILFLSTGQLCLLNCILISFITLSVTASLQIWILYPILAISSSVSTLVAFLSFSKYRPVLLLARQLPQNQASSSAHCNLSEGVQLLNKTVTNDNALYSSYLIPDKYFSAVAPATFLIPIKYPIYIRISSFSIGKFNLTPVAASQLKFLNLSSLYR